MNRAVYDLMFASRLSKYKQRPLCVVDISSSPKKRNPRRPREHHRRQRKSRPWIDNGRVELSMADKAIITAPTGWLSDKIIDAAQTTLREQFGIPGFQSVNHGQTCSFDVEPNEFIQILHNGHDHWLTISTIGSKHPGVFVYDSLYSEASDELQQQIACLLHTQEPGIMVKFAKVESQTNSSDCGIYAIAFATALCLETSPAKLVFDDSRMRGHLAQCLERGKFTMFPVRQRRRKTAINAHTYIPLHCTCRMPDIAGVELIECTKCKNWHHIPCARPSEAVVECAELSWYCNFCNAV